MNDTEALTLRITQLEEQIAASAKLTLEAAAATRKFVAASDAQIRTLTTELDHWRRGEMLYLPCSNGCGEFIVQAKGQPMECISCAMAK